MSAQWLSAGEMPAPEGAAAGSRADARPFFSTLPAGPRQRRLALWVVLLSGAVFVCAAPFAKAPLPAMPAFLPIYQSALVLIDLLTAVLIFGQFAMLGSRPLLLLGGAYFFSACMAVAHALSFPGLFAQGGLLGAGSQTTAWLYFLWHGGFPLAVLGYALMPEAKEAVPGTRPLGAILAGAGIVALLVAALYALTTLGHDSLPVIMQGNRDAPAKVFVATASWMLALATIPVLWRRRPYTVLDLWLMVVLWVWVFDIALASVLNAGRYDVGWYGGRIYGLLAGSFVLVVMLLEHTHLYGELLKARDTERRRSQMALDHHARRLRLLHSIDRSIVAGESPQAIAGVVVQPLRELLDVPRAIVNVFDLEIGQVEWLAAAGRHKTHVGGGVRYSIRLMGDVEALKRGEPQIIDTHALPPGPETQALLASGVQTYMVVPMIAGGELIGAVSFGGERPSFPRDQVAIAQEVATQLAIAISQARLLEQVRGHAEDLERKVRDRTEELRATNRELEAFSYSVSHDLRSPLRAIDGYALMLEEDFGAKLDDEGRRLLGVVRQEALRMGQLIEDLLRFARVGRAPLAVAPIDLASHVRGVVVELSAAHPKTRIEIGTLPAAIGDASLLRQVWVNLISNAIKYSAKREEPLVEVGGSARGEENVYWVRDNGAGFDMRYQEKLFKVFQRLHRPEEFEGTGVGLAIVMRVITRHGGKVWGEGEAGKGACFYFSLPATPRDRTEDAV